MSEELPEKRYRYEVKSVWGSMENRMKVGTVLVDYNHGEDHDWQVFDNNAGEISGGFYGVFLNEVTEPHLLDQIRDNDAKRAEQLS